MYARHLIVGNGRKSFLSVELGVEERVKIGWEEMF